MNGRTVSWIMFTLLLTGIFTFAANIQPVEAEPKTIIVPEEYPTLQAAINAASPGDTIFVRNGTYYEHVVVNKAVSLVGENRSNTIIDGNGTGTVVKTLASHVLVRDFTIQRSSPRWEGVQIGATYCAIAHNNIANNGWGVYSDIGSPNICIFGNNITNNRDGIVISGRWNNIFGNNITANDMGINLLSSPADNRISGNNITNNVYGIMCDRAKNNSISGNNIANNAVGIDAGTGTDCNRIYGNNITGNTDVGIGIDYYADRNIIYNNNFIDNMDHVNFITRVSNNTWDDGYPSGGNYWSDYTGVDAKSGPYQNETGSDGIGDIPYVVEVNNIDHYPLIYPYPPHDIVVVDAVCNRTWVYQGHSIGINVTISNKGDYHENVTVTLYYNITANKIIGVETINMLITENQTITFAWDTTSVEYCHNYTITAVASIASPDAHPSDNTLTDGKVKVRIMGDINDDKIVDMADVSIIIDAFLAEPWHPRWNPEADLNQDRIVDLADISIAIDNFLQEFTP